jgi:hypothetical protein
VSSCCTSLSSASRPLATRICLSKPIPQSTYNTLTNPKILGYFYLVVPPSSILIALFTSNTLKCRLLSIFGQNNTVQPHTQIGINDYSFKINISWKKNSVKSITKKKFFYADLVLTFKKKMQVLSMFRSPCTRRFPPKIIIIRIERGETIKDRRERGEGLFGLWSLVSEVRSVRDCERG